MIWWSVDMVGLLECIKMVLGGDGAMYFYFSKWCNGESIFFTHMLKWWIYYGVMVIWWNFPMANWFFGTHFHQYWNGEKVKCNLRVEVDFFVGVNFVPWDNYPGGQWLLKQILSPREKIPRDMSRVRSQMFLFPGKTLENTWNTIGTHIFKTCVLG